MIQLDDATAAQLEKVAPGSGRKRSEFLRGVIARALHEALEAGTRKAYERWPDDVATIARGDWADDEEAVHPPAPKKARTARPGKKARR